MIKKSEQATAGKPEKTTLAGVPRSLPALLRADHLSRKAAAAGFDWQRATDVLELREAVTIQGVSSDEAEEELGDLLFAIANLARKLGIAPEAALKRANDKFQARFEHMEQAATSEGHRLSELSFDDLDARWNRAKSVTGDKDAKATKITKEG